MERKRVLLSSDMYEYNKNACFSATEGPSLPPPPPPPSSSPQDEISLFLRQILLHSSSTPASSLATQAGKETHFSMSPPTAIAGLNTAESSHLSYRSSLFQDGGISAVDSTGGGVSPSPAVFFSSSKGSSSAKVSSSSAGASEIELDEYDCESEEGLEALVEEVARKRVPSKNSSKRSRAAEVHNLSEKRRRSRINEKMKALQNLIPNSNKTDKASMLDEAIEYLKQLQLQVQMLSMRNGLSLHPMCLPGALQPIHLSGMRMELSEENQSLPLNVIGSFPLHQENPVHNVCSLPNQHIASNQPSMPSLSYMVNSEASYGLDSSFHAPLRPFQLQRSAEGICRNDMLQPHSQLDVNCPDTNPLDELGSGALAMTSLSFSTETSELRDNSSLEMCITGIDQHNVILANSQ